MDVLRLSQLRERELEHPLHEPSRLEFHLIQFVTAGRGAHEVDFARVPLAEGDVLHVRPDQVHAFDAASEHEALLLLFPPGTLEEAHIPMPARWQLGKVLRPASSDFDALVQLLRLQADLDLGAADMRPGTIGPHLLGAVLAALAEVVAAKHGQVDPTAQRYEALVLEFEELLAAQRGRPKGLAWYAPKLATTPRTLARACKLTRGATPKRLIDLRVALEAKRQLATTDRTVEAIGYALGFSEPTNFVKYFRRVVGTTPDAFRRAQGG